jgi:hypothetical protein
MNYALKKSDSTLASAITELRIITTVKKLWKKNLSFYS